MTITAEHVREKLGDFANNCDALDLHHDAEILRIAAEYIARRFDDFTAWLDTPQEPPEEETECPACGFKGTDIDPYDHAFGCPEVDWEGLAIDEAHEIAKDKEMGL